MATFHHRNMGAAVSQNAQHHIYTARSAYLCFAVLIVILWFPEPLALPGGMSVAVFLMILAIFLAAKGALLRKYAILDPLSKSVIGMILMSSTFIILWSIVSVFGVPQPLRAGRVILTHFFGMGTFLLIYATFTTSRARTLIGVCLLTAVGVSMLSLMGYFNGALRALLFDEGDRSFGFFKHPNQFGIALSTVAPVALAMALSASRYRAAKFFVLLAIIFGLVASGSKTNILLFAMVSSAILIIAPALKEGSVRRILNIILNLGVAVAMAGLLLFVLSTFNPRALLILGNFFSQDAEVKSLVSREWLWDYSIRQFIDHPVFGQGAGQYLETPHNEGMVPHSHNVILDYSRMLGVPGLAAMLVVLLAVIFALTSTIILSCRLKAVDREHRMITIGLCFGGLSYILANMSSDSFGPSTSPLFWFVTYLAIFMRSAWFKQPRTRSVTRMSFDNKAPTGAGAQYAALNGAPHRRKEDVE